MKISTIFYCIWQGIRNFFRNKWFTLLSIATIATCLFLFGVFYSVLENFRNIVHTAEEDVSVVVFFENGIEKAERDNIEQKIRRRTEVRDVVFVSAEQAWEEFSKDYVGDSAVTFTENPLENSANFQVYLRDVSQQSALVTYIESLPGVRDVRRSELVADTLAGVNSLIGYISLGIIILLLVVSVFMINNTVTVGISVRKEEINIMKYVGATDFFVRSPFVIEGILIGLIGSVIPLGIIYYIYNNVTDYIANKFAILKSMLTFLPVQEIFQTLVPVSVVVGVGLGFIGSYVTVKRHLHV